MSVILAVGSIQESTNEEFDDWTKFAIGTELKFMNNRIHIEPIGDDDNEGDITPILNDFVCKTPKSHIFIQ